MKNFPAKLILKICAQIMFISHNNPLQYPSGKQFLCSFPHSSSNASLPLTSLTWVGSSLLLTSNFTSRGSTKLKIQVLKIRTVRPAFQRTETRKEEKTKGNRLSENLVFTASKKRCWKCCFVFLYTTYFDTSKIIIYSNMLSGHISPGETRKAGKSPRS